MSILILLHYLKLCHISFTLSCFVSSYSISPWTASSCASTLHHLLLYYFVASGVLYKFLSSHTTLSPTSHCIPFLIILFRFTFFYPTLSHELIWNSLKDGHLLIYFLVCLLSTFIMLVCRRDGCTWGRACRHGYPVCRKRKSRRRERSMIWRRMKIKLRYVCLLKSP